MDRTGKCLCGAVTFTAKSLGDASACHCGMCRRWSGGIWLGVSTKDLTFTQADAVQTIQSSQWAERGFCNKCGTSLFYRVTADGKFAGHTSVSVGCLDDASGIEIGREWFIDRKPEGYTLAGDHEKVTEAQVMAMFAAPS